MVVSLANFRRVRNEMRARRAEQVADLLPSMIVAISVASSRRLPETLTLQPSRIAEDSASILGLAETLADVVAQRQLELRQHACSLRMEDSEDDDKENGA